MVRKWGKKPGILSIAKETGLSNDETIYTYGPSNVSYTAWLPSDRL